MSCCICFDKAELICEYCKLRVCAFDCSVKLLNSRKTVTCNICGFTQMGSGELKNLQTIREASNSKLLTLDTSISDLSSELNSLVDHEIALSNKLDAFLATSSERLGLTNSKLMLEVQSRTNSLQSSSNIYRAIENLAQKLESLNSTYEILSSESSHLAMVNSHISSYVTELSSSISTIKGKFSNQINSTSLVQIEKQLCSKCQVHLLGFTLTPTTRPTKDGSCTSCQVS